MAAIVIATAENKTSGTGTELFQAQQPQMQEKLLNRKSKRINKYIWKSQLYNTSQGTPTNGYELNEYGLMAAYSLLGVSNPVYVTRADIDPAELASSTSRSRSTHQ